MTEYVEPEIIPTEETIEEPKEETNGEPGEEPNGESEEANEES